MSLMPDKHARDIAMLIHLLGFAGFFVPLGNLLGPLIVWLLRKEEFRFVDNHGRAALNFQISFTIYYLLLAGGFVGTFVSPGFEILTLTLIILLLVVLGIAYLVFIIIATIKASEGKPYVYPLSISFLQTHFPVDESS